MGPERWEEELWHQEAVLLCTNTHPSVSVCSQPRIPAKWVNRLHSVFSFPMECCIWGESVTLLFHKCHEKKIKQMTNKRGFLPFLESMLVVVSKLTAWEKWWLNSHNTTKVSSVHLPLCKTRPHKLQIKETTKTLHRSSLGEERRKLSCRRSSRQICYQVYRWSSSFGSLSLSQF